MYTTVSQVEELLPAGSGITQEEITQAIITASSNVDAFIGDKLASDEVKDIFVENNLVPMLDFSVRGFNDEAFKIVFKGRVIPKSYIVSFPLNASHTEYFKWLKTPSNCDDQPIKIQNAKIGRYALSEVPAEIQKVVAIIASNLAKNGLKEFSALPKNSETIGSYSVSYAQSGSTYTGQISADPSITDVLNKYKRVALY